MKKNPKHKERAPIPIVALDNRGVQHHFGSVREFMEAKQPLPSSQISEWGKSSRVEIHRILRGDGGGSSYGGWRFRYAGSPEESFEDRSVKYQPADAEEAIRREEALQDLKSRTKLVETATEALDKGVHDVDSVKQVLRKQYLRIIEISADVRESLRDAPKGWKAKDDIEVLEKTAEAWGIDWRHIVDTRTDADKVADSIREILQRGPQEIYARTDDELDAMERAFEDARLGCLDALRRLREEEDLVTEAIKSRYTPDGKKKGEFSASWDGDDAIDHDDDAIDHGDERDDESQSAPEVVDDEDDPGEAGVDGPSGGADRPPAPGSLGD